MEIPESAIARQLETLRNSYLATAPANFGIERLLRLILLVLGFAFPALYIREWSGRYGYVFRKLAVELYVFAKLAFPVVAMIMNWDCYGLVLCLIGYLLAENLTNAIGILFLDDLFPQPFSPRRSFTLLLLNYFEIIVSFAALYRGLELVPGIQSWVDALYFSTMTGLTVGYGDLKPEEPAGRLLTCAQVSILAVFVVSVLGRMVPPHPPVRPK